MKGEIPQFALETLEQVRASGVEELLTAHWLEIAYYEDIPLEPDWDAYAASEASGSMRIFTVRIAGKLIGYAVYLLKHHPHYKSTLFAAQDVLYLAPAHRGGRIGAHLILFADTYLESIGVQLIAQHSKARRDIDIGPLLERLGYELMDTVWTKRLDRERH